MNLILPCVIVCLVWSVILAVVVCPRADPAPTKTETLSCVRVKQVTPAGTINYLCEVRK